MATSKTLAPTNVTISIPAMTDQPNASVLANCADKEADAINALNSQIASEAVNMSQYLISAESEATCIMFRCGKVRTMTFQGVARVHTEDEVFMTVPEGDRVKGGNYIHCIGMVGGTPVVVRFNGSSGNLSIFILNGGTSNSRLYFQITWVTP